MCGVCVAGIFEEASAEAPGVASVDSTGVVRRGEVGEGIDDHGDTWRERERRKPREAALESLGNW